MSVLFYKYIRNNSSNLYEIQNLSLYDGKNFKKFLKIHADTCAPQLYLSTDETKHGL